MKKRSFESFEDMVGKACVWTENIVDKAYDLLENIGNRIIRNSALYQRTLKERDFFEQAFRTETQKIQEVASGTVDIERRIIAERAEAGKRYEKLVSQHTELQQSNKTLAEQNAQLSAEKTDLARQHAGLGTQYEKATSELKTAMESLAEYEALLAKKEEEKAQLGADLAISRGKGGRLEREIERIGDLVDYRNQEIQAIKAGIMGNIANAIISAQKQARKYTPFVVFLDSKNRIIRASPQTLKLMGYSAEEAEGRNYIDFLKEGHKVTRAIESKLAQETEESPLEIDIESVELVRKNGKTIPLDIGAFVLYRVSPIKKDKKIYIGSIIYMDRLRFVRRAREQLKTTTKRLADEARNILAKLSPPEPNSNPTPSSTCFPETEKTPT